MPADETGESPPSIPTPGAEPTGPPTMKAVGARAGVSAMTVSRVLHDDPAVVPQTRQRVLDAIAELGYRRNELASSFRKRATSGMVGLVVTNLANPFYSQLALGVETVLADHGLKLVVANTNENVDYERQLVGDFTARRVDGIIAVAAGLDQQHLTSPYLARTPVVLCARPPIDIEADCVLLDDVGGARQAVQWLLARGHRRVAFLGPPAAWTSAERLRGYRETLSEAGIAVDERYVRCEQRDVATAEKVALELLHLDSPPTAFFCANSRNTIGTYRALRRTGGEVAVAGFDEFELADTLGIPLALATYDTEEMGRVAARMLLERIENGKGENPPPQRIVLPTKLVEY